MSFRTTGDNIHKIEIKHVKTVSDILKTVQSYSFDVFVEFYLRNHQIKLGIHGKKLFYIGIGSVIVNFFTS